MKNNIIEELLTSDIEENRILGSSLLKSEYIPENEREEYIKNLIKNHLDGKYVEKEILENEDEITPLLMEIYAGQEELPSELIVNREPDKNLTDLLADIINKKITNYNFNDFNFLDTLLIIVLSNSLKKSFN